MTSVDLWWPVLVNILLCVCVCVPVLYVSLGVCGEELGVSGGWCSGALWEPKVLSSILTLSCEL